MAHLARRLIRTRPSLAERERRRAILIGFALAPKRKLTSSPSVAPLVLRDDVALARAYEHLSQIDAGLMAALDALAPRPPLRARPPGFEGLAAIIVSQQVSTASANAIFGRLKARLGTIEAATLAAVSDDELRACGLSAPKLRTLRAIAAAVEDGALDFADLQAASAETAHARLCTIRGIGPWTADVFLLFCLGHADAWPAGDLALQEGARLVLGLAARPSAEELRTLGERWRPLRGAAAYCLWAYYGAARRRAATLEPPAPEPTATPRPRRQRKT